MERHIQILLWNWYKSAYVPDTESRNFSDIFRHLLDIDRTTLADPVLIEDVKGKQCQKERRRDKFNCPITTVCLSWATEIARQSSEIRETPIKTCLRTLVTPQYIVKCCHIQDVHKNTQSSYRGFVWMWSLFDLMVLENGTRTQRERGGVEI